MAGVLLEQVRQGGADRERDAEHVGEHHRAPLLGRLLQEAAGGAEAGVGEDRVEAPEALDGGLDEALVVLEVGHVGAHGERAVVSAELTGQRLELLLRAGAEHQPVAGLGGGAGGRLADPGRGAGDQQHWVVGHRRDYPVAARESPLR